MEERVLVTAYSPSLPFSLAAAAAPLIVKVGDPLNFIPEYSYTINANYEFNWISSVRGFANVGYYRQGPSFSVNRSTVLTVLNAEEVGKSDPLGFLNMQVGAYWKDLRFKFFANNLNNERRATNPPDGTNVFRKNRPRTIGIEFNYSF